MNWKDKLKFDDRGLIPAVVQDLRSGRILMLAYMNRESLEKTLETGVVHFWSRSRGELWKKGETSGNFFKLKGLSCDCDEDALLLRVEASGPACHTGEISCFFNELKAVAEPEEGPQILDEVYRVILDRKAKPREDSYVSQLLGRGKDSVLKKVLEEASEVLLAAERGDSVNLTHEMADLWFHSLIVLAASGVPPEKVFGELARRRGHSGLRKGKGKEN